MPPADSPAMVTLDGSPPNAAMLSCTHCSAATWSSMPTLPDWAYSPKCPPRFMNPWTPSR